MPHLPNATTEPDVIVDGHRIYYVWHRPKLTPVRTEADGQITARIESPSLPMGMLIQHGSANRSCIAWVPWIETDDADLPHWTLLSLVPLSIAEPFTCSNCGLLGGIRNGQWWMGLNQR